MKGEHLETWTVMVPDDAIGRRVQPERRAHVCYGGYTAVCNLVSVAVHLGDKPTPKRRPHAR